MKTYGIIYKYTSPSKRCYIGQTVNEKARKDGHRSAEWDFEQDTKFARAIRSHGFESLIYEVIDYANNQDELNEKEIYWIKFYDSINSGYNITEGGAAGPAYKHSDIIVRDVQLLLKQGKLTTQQIADTTGTSICFVSTIRNATGSRNLETLNCPKKSRKGSTNGKAKLTEEQVEQIRERLKNNEKRSDLQKEYGVSKTLIQLIATNKVWNHVEQDYEYKKKETNGNAKLTREIVKELKKDMWKMERKDVAEKYGISIPTVDQIKAGKTWKDV